MTNTYTKEFNQFYDAVVTSMRNHDVEELRHLEYVDGVWYQSVLDILDDLHIVF